MSSIAKAELNIPSVTALLVAGGDARIAPDAHSGCNKYGCRSYPDADLLAFGSSTASVISEQGFEAAVQLRDKLQNRASTEPAVTTYARELDRVRAELVALCGIGDLPGLEVVFAASGTDSHLIAAQLVRNQGQPLCAVMIDAVETGSGVPAALAGRHFSTRTALAQAVDEGVVIAGDAIAVVTVAMRAADGSPYTAAAMDAGVTARVHAAVAAGQRVLLTLVDVSKTGMIVPGPACVAALQRQFPEQLDVLVDACQFRIAPSTLRAYLQQGYMVAVTGSKFITGPTFSGALLIPSGLAQGLRRYPVPASLRAYSAAADWSRNWDCSRLDAGAVNFGLLLRWEAALTELRAFHAIPETEIAAFLQVFADAIQGKLDSDPVFERVAVPVRAGASWDSFPTIFPFMLRRPAGATGYTWLSSGDMSQIYRLLQCDLSSDAGLPADSASRRLLASRVQLGQPVRCGVRDGMPVSALRLCMSARLVVAALSPRGPGPSAVIAQALIALEKTALLVNADLA
ncbi:MAG: hypothetical protein P4L77_02875 [Sulfuriferula sp.]|nr:hypothetical protein [Sulfuriferula sp.]